MTRDHDIRRHREPRHGRLRELQRAPRIGARHAALALPLERQQRIGRGAAGPARGRQAGDPQPVELESGGFERAENLDARAGVLGLKERACERRAQRRHGIAARQRACEVAERGEVAQRAPERVARLPFRAAERRVAGPAHRVEPGAPGVGPDGRPLPTSAGRHRAPPAFGQSRVDFGQHRQHRAVGDLGFTALAPAPLQARAPPPPLRASGKMAGTQQGGRLRDG